MNVKSKEREVSDAIAQIKEAKHVIKREMKFIEHHVRQHMNHAECEEPIRVTLNSEGQLVITWGPVSMLYDEWKTLRFTLRVEVGNITWSEWVWACKLMEWHRQYIRDEAQRRATGKVGLG